jgi:hypothetical protein
MLFKPNIITLSKFYKPWILERWIMFSRKLTLVSVPILISCLLFVGTFSGITFSDALTSFNFGATGDWGCSSNTGKTVTNIKGKGPERVLAIGDYSYSSTATCWLDKISDIKSKTRIAIGNHEDDNDEGFSQYMNAFSLSKTYYSFTFSKAHVIVMDTDRVSFTSGSAQYNFVKSDLQSASKNPAIKWIIVYMHKQMYTSPNTCSSSSCSNGGSDANSLRKTYHAMFDDYGVDLVLQGHVHNYQRTYPISYSGSGTPKITTTCSTNCNDPKGQVFAVVGTGGINFHALSGKSSFVKYQQDDKFGALNIIINNNENKLTGQYYANGGSKLDEFSITKPSATAQYNYGPSLSLSGK